MNAVKAGKTTGAFPFAAFDRHECHLLAEACASHAEMLEGVYAQAEADGEGDEMATVAHDAVALRKMQAAFEAAELSKAES